ncbi:MAG: hypothetical protein KYX65_12700, partial [Tabrizicola sp.]|nr:hypothetical protein [Tabrizicola sp.]
WRHRATAGPRPDCPLAAGAGVTAGRGDASFTGSIMRPPMKAYLPLAFLALAACQNPMLSTNLVFGDAGAKVSPAISGKVGGTTVTIED